MDLEVMLTPDRIAAMEARGDWAGRTVLDYLEDTVAAAPERTAVIAHASETGKTATLTYAELDRTARRIALGLADLGVGPGDVVSFQLPNWWQFTALHLACVHVGAISNPLMPIFRERELRFMLGFAQSKVYVAPARFRGFDYPAMMRASRARIARSEAPFLYRRRRHAVLRTSVPRKRLLGRAGRGQCARGAPHRPQRRDAGALHLRHDGAAQGRHAHREHAVRLPAADRRALRHGRR